MGEAIQSFVEMTGFSMIANDPKVLIMIAISLVLMYLAIVKKFEPLLLLPIAFGMLLPICPARKCITASFLPAAMLTGPR